jgi:hypothetical protein
MDSESQIHHPFGAYWWIASIKNRFMKHAHKPIFDLLLNLAGHA